MKQIIIYSGLVAFLFFSCDGGEDLPGNPPVADAGNDQLISGLRTVSLDGSNSSDPDGDTLTFLWSFVSQPNGSSASIFNNDQERAQFNSDALGVYVVELRVQDGIHPAQTDEVEITVEESNNNFPVAEIAEVSAVAAGETITLDGTGSSDPDGDELSYNWSIISSPTDGGGTTITNSTQATASINSSVSGTYVIELRVRDPEGLSDTEQVQAVFN
jgi:hypothetical protein